MTQEALGLVETRGLVASIEAADQMCKAANVQFIRCEKRLGGRLVTVVVEGTVSACQASLEAGKAEAAKVGKVKLGEVIPRPHPEVMKFLKPKKA